MLKAEHPDVDSKRSYLLKLQGEFMLRLHHLEQSLLQALNEVKGRILDNDRYLHCIETEATHIASASMSCKAKTWLQHARWCCASTIIAFNIFCCSGFCGLMVFLLLCRLCIIEQPVGCFTTIVLSWSSESTSRSSLSKCM